MDTGQRRHWPWLLLAAIGVSAMVVGFIVMRAPEPVQHAETGYSFPKPDSISSISAIEVADYQQDKVRSFEVPRTFWPDVLAALSPSELDSSPRKMEVFGRLKIQAEGQEPIFVVLFWRPDIGGEFGVGPDGRRSLNYYRGGNSQRLERIVARAGVEVEHSNPATP